MTKHEAAANKIIAILRDAGDVGFAASRRDEIEEALEEAFPLPEPPLLTQEHGRMMREICDRLSSAVILGYYGPHAGWSAQYAGVGGSSNHGDTAAAAIEAAHAAFSKAKEGQSDAKE